MLCRVGGSVRSRSAPLRSRRTGASRFCARHCAVTGVELLLEHGLQHLDLHEITTSRRAVTQTIAADLYDRDATAAVRFPSRLDGGACVALFENRGRA